MSRSQSYEPRANQRDVNKFAYTNASMRHQKAFNDRFPYAKVTEEAHESDGEDGVVHHRENTVSASAYQEQYISAIDQNEVVQYQN